MLAHASRKMIPALSRLWQECFGDSASYVQFFMDRRFRPEDTLVWLEGNQPVGVAYLLPCTIDGQLARYGYAIAVLPHRQSKGIGRELVNGLLEMCREESSLFFGTPLPGLEDYYHRLGSLDAFYRRTGHLEGEGAVHPLDIADAPDGLYTQLRDDAFGGGGFVRWDQEAVSYALAEQRISGGFAHVLTWAHRQYLLFGTCAQGCLHLRETTLPLPLIHELAPSLCAFYRARQIVWHFSDKPGPDCLPYGCCWKQIPPSGWFGLDLT